jgi:hypothetical protein
MPTKIKAVPIEESSEQPNTEPIEQSLEQPNNEVVEETKRSIIRYIIRTKRRD